jgi:hypothetical protein
MSGNDDQMEIEVEVEEAQPKADDITVEPVEKVQKQAKKPEIEPDVAIDELNRRLEQERQARMQAEHSARLAAAQAERAQSEVKDTNYHLVESAIETLKREKQLVKQQLAEAHAHQDFDRIVELQDELSKHNADLSDLKRGQKAMKNGSGEGGNTIAPEPVAPPQGSLIDQIAANVTPRSAAWINANRDTLNDERVIRKMFRAHEDAVEDGISPDSDDYFRYIEGRLGFSASSEESRDQAQATRRSSPPAAPVSLGGNGTGSRPNVVSLTSEQREMAQMMGMSDQEYARNLLALQKEGKINRH